MEYDFFYISFTESVTKSEEKVVKDALNSRAKEGWRVVTSCSTYKPWGHYPGGQLFFTLERETRQ